MQTNDLGLGDGYAVTHLNDGEIATLEADGRTYYPCEFYLVLDTTSKSHARGLAAQQIGQLREQLAVAGLVHVTERGFALSNGRYFNCISMAAVRDGRMHTITGQTSVVC